MTVVLFEVLWPLGPWIRKAVECFKYCFMGNTSRNMEDSGVVCDLMKFGDLTQEVLEENINRQPADHSWDILIPCPERLPKASIKLRELINSVVRENLKNSLF